MSAAEKLAALESPNGPWLDQFGLTLAAGAGMTLRNALPEIIAVVKAAERLEHARQVTLDRSETMDEHGSLAAALAALDEALGDVT